MNGCLHAAVLTFNCILSALSQAFLKRAAQNEYRSFWGVYLNPLVAFGYFLFVAVLALNIWLLQFMPLNVVSSVGESLPLILSLFVGRFFFGERISLLKIVGAACAVVGIVIVVVK